MAELNKKKWYSFWVWLAKGYGGKAGYRKFITFWIVVDFCIALFLSDILTNEISEVATTITFPLLAMLIGLTIGASSNAYAVITRNEIQKLSELKDGGLPDYVYPFNLALLIILFTVCYWSLAASSVMDGKVLFLKGVKFSYLEIFGFLLFSYSLRISWQTILGHASLVLAVHEVKKFSGDKEES